MGCTYTGNLISEQDVNKAEQDVNKAEVDSEVFECVQLREVENIQLNKPTD